MREPRRQFALLGSSGFVGMTIASHLRRQKIDFESVRIRPWFTSRSLALDGGMPDRQLRQAVDGKHVVIAVAAGVDGQRMSDEDQWLNEHGRPALAQMCEEGGAASITMIGSCFEFGPRDRFELIQSGETEYPSDVYSSTLLAGCRSFLAAEGAIPRKYLRLFQLFGKGERSSRLFPSVCDALRSGIGVDLRTPNAIRDFCLVDDVANAVTAIAQSDEHVGKMNICSGQGMSVREFAELCADAFAIAPEKRKSMLRFGSSRHPYPFLVGEPYDDACKTTPVDMHSLSEALA